MYGTRGSARVNDDHRWRQEYEADKQLMAALDARTEIPHVLIELRSLGYIEICGKDMGGIYKRLEEWFHSTWGAEHMSTELKKVPDMHAFQHEQVGWEEGFTTRLCELKEYDRLCDISFHWEPNTPECSCLPVWCCGLKTVTSFKMRGNFGENNLGKLTMQLINFMTNTCGWGLKLCNGTNLGFYGQIREQQVKFKAPHPLNLIAPHLMIELRQAGWIEVNGPNTNGIHDKLERWLKEAWRASRVKADPQYCDVKFKCGSFRSRGSEGENNMGLRTMEIVDFMVKTCAWTMITCNGGNYGRYGDIREQQMVFRDDGHVQHGEDHIMVELRDIGYIEVNGLFSSPDIEAGLDGFLKKEWKCRDYNPGFWEKDKFCDRKYVTPENFYFKQGLTNNIGKLTIELSMFLASQGWMLALCNGGHTSSIKQSGNTMPSAMGPGQAIYELCGGIKREQQIKFTKARVEDNPGEPLLMIELRAVPKDPPSCIKTPDREMFRPKSETARLGRELSRQVRDWVARGEYQGLIEVNGLNINNVYQHLNGFIAKFMRGKAEGPTAYCDCLFTCDVFRQKMASHSEFWDGYYCGENNFGKYTMRLCDFLVDHLGEWDLIVCNGNAAERAWKFGSMTSLVAREQQMVFRHRRGGRAVFQSTLRPDAPLGRSPLHPPDYWKDGSKQGETPHEVIPATAEELRWLQELLDGTYINKVTRDRRGGALANRFVVVAAVRSEHAILWDAFAKRRVEVGERAARAHGREVCWYWAKGSCKHGEQCRYRHESAGALITPKTVKACPSLHERCRLPEGKNPSNEAYFMHGTNPTSAVAILRTDFKIDLAGASAGTMFGPGAYLAEASTKADEYAQDDKDGAYKGLFAMCVCRAAAGRSFVSEKPGDHSKRILSGEFDSVLGDREKAVGTFREFIFFHEESIFPEFAVFYRREFSSSLDDVPGADAPVKGVSTRAASAQVAPWAPPMPLSRPGYAQNSWQVIIPAGQEPGSTFRATLPSGGQMDLTVLTGVNYQRPGGIMSFRGGS